MTKFKNSHLEVNFLHPEPSAVYQNVLQIVRHNDFQDFTPYASYVCLPFKIRNLCSNSGLSTDISHLSCGPQVVALFLFALRDYNQKRP